MNKLQKKFGIFALSLSAMFWIGSCSSPESSHENHEHASHDHAGTEASIPEFSEINPALKTHIQTLTANYLEVKDALVQTNVAATQEAAQKLLASMEAYEPADLNDEQLKFYTERVNLVKDNARKISESNDVEKQRSYFLDLTNGIYSFEKAFHAHTQDLYFQYCPMAFDDQGAGWVSDKKEIRNPYFGDKMLKCGKVKETF